MRTLRWLALLCTLLVTSAEAQHKTTQLDTLTAASPLAKSVDTAVTRFCATKTSYSYKYMRAVCPYPKVVARLLDRAISAEQSYVVKPDTIRLVDTVYLITPKPDTAPTPLPPPPTVPPPSQASGHPTDLITNGAVLAELPRVTGPLAATVPTRATKVPAGANLQTYLNAATCGDELLLAAGATYTGNFALPARGCIGWVTVRTDKTEGVGRITPATAVGLARIVTPGYSAAIGTAPGTSGWRLAELEVTVAAGVAEVNMLVRLGDSGPIQTTVASIPTNIILDRVWVHGNAVMNLKRCVTLNSGSTSVLRSYLDDCHYYDQDSQALIGYNGPGPFLIHDNYLAGGHMGVMFGGADPAVPGLTPTDITITRNHLSRPLAWKGKWLTKTIIESKHARRLLVEGNVIENVWASAQAGYAMLLKAENQDGSARQSTTRDVTIRYNKFRMIGSGINIASKPGWAPVDSAAARFTIYHNIAESFAGAEGIPWQVLGDVAHVTIIHNTMLNAKPSLKLISLDGGANTAFLYDANVGYTGDYGVHSSGGVPRTPGTVWRTNLAVETAPYTCGADKFKWCVPALPATLPVGYDGTPIGADTAKVNAAVAGVAP